MFGLDTTLIAVVALAALAAGAMGYGVLYNRLEADKKTTTRLNRVKAAETDRGKVNAARDRMAEVNERRKSMQEQLKGLEEKQKENDRRKSPPLPDKIMQAGLTISMRQFYTFSVILGAFLAFAMFISNHSDLQCSFQTTNFN